MNWLDRKAMRDAFERAAPDYDAHAVLQREVGARLLGRLDYLKVEPRRVLDAGCGTGHGSKLLRARYPDAQLIGLDIAFAMLARSRAADPPASPWRRLLSRGQAAAHYVCADAQRVPLAAGSLDLVHSNLMLQWCESPAAVFRAWHRVLRPGGLALFATFGPDTLKELRAAFAGIDGLPHVSPFIDMHDLGDMLVHAGFETPVMEMETLVLTYADLRGLLQDIRGVGGHNAARERARGLMGKARWSQLQRRYEEYRREGRLPASYEVIYGHAWAGAVREMADGRAVIQWKIDERRRRNG